MVTILIVVLLLVVAACQGQAIPTQAPEVVAPTAIVAATTAPEPTSTNPPLTKRPEPTVATQPTSPPPPSGTAAPAPAASPTEEPAPSATPEPTSPPQPTATPPATATPVPATATPAPTAAPTAAPTPEPTSAAVSQTVFDEYGFSLGIDRGAQVLPAGTPAVEQGIIRLAYGDVNAILSWTPQRDSNLLALVSGTYDLVKNNQTGLTFETLKDGEFTVDGESGWFLGFKAEGGSGTPSGGLIGAWICSASQTSFVMTLTGADAAVVQLRFDGLRDDFKCSS